MNRRATRCRNGSDSVMKRDCDKRVVRQPLPHASIANVLNESTCSPLHAGGRSAASYGLSGCDISGLFQLEAAGVHEVAFRGASRFVHRVILDSPHKIVKRIRNESGNESR